MSIRYLREARDELAAAVLWYEQQETLLGDDFLREVQAAEAWLSETPRACALWPGIREARAIRRCVLPRFPYCLAYELHDEEIVILAVAHTSRRPLYWIERSE
ncbi:MAG: type II toxin-antitoxin system RelE/ParE family toxin [Myxococcales bacterium]|nr:type II toxin-antitoxin system RelE/ParE family toxin [Myxococcales bacterium]